MPAKGFRPLPRTAWWKHFTPVAPVSCLTSAHTRRGDVYSTWRVQTTRQALHCSKSSRKHPARIASAWYACSTSRLSLLNELIGLDGCRGRFRRPRESYSMLIPADNRGRSQQISCLRTARGTFPEPRHAPAAMTRAKLGNDAELPLRGLRRVKNIHDSSAQSFEPICLQIPVIYLAC